METMTVKTRYVITDTDHLISPKGYNLNQPVYKQTTIAIHCNKIPTKLPRTSKPLYVHDVQKIISRS